MSLVLYGESKNQSYLDLKTVRINQTVSLCISKPDEAALQSN